jgi:hypothetical protein
MTTLNIKTGFRIAYNPGYTDRIPATFAEWLRMYKDDIYTHLELV